MKSKNLPSTSALKYPVKPNAPTLSATNPSKAARAARARAITEDQIAARAYEIWVAKGFPVGRDMESWLEAERELSDPLYAGEAPLPRTEAELDDDSSLQSPADKRIFDDTTNPPERRSATSL